VKFFEVKWQTVQHQGPDHPDELAVLSEALHTDEARVVLSAEAQDFADELVPDERNQAIQRQSSVIEQQIKQLAKIHQSY